jgi:hypothetical protein
MLRIFVLYLVLLSFSIPLAIRVIMLRPGVLRENISRSAPGPVQARRADLRRVGIAGAARAAARVFLGLVGVAPGYTHARARTHARASI